MSTSMRFLLVALTALLAAWGLHAWVYVPNHCNVVVTRGTARTLIAEESGASAAATLRARRNLEYLLPARRSCGQSGEFHQLIARNELLLGRFDEAIANYRKALAIAEVPLIHSAIGEIYIQMGRTDDAVAEYLQAARYHPLALHGIRSDEVARRVTEELMKEQRAQQAVR